MIRAVVFDVGGVLTEPVGPVFARRAIAAGLDLAPAHTLFASFADVDTPDEPAHRLERGEITIEEFFAALGPHETVARTLMDASSEHFVPASFVPEQSMHAFVREVRERGYRTGVVTNVVREWTPWWHRVMPDPAWFDVVVQSCDVGLRKPDPAIYLLAVDVLGVEPHEVLYLDDFPAMAAAARDLGMVAVDVTDHAQALETARRLLGPQA